MKHWRIEQVARGRFDPARVDPEIVPLVKAAAMVEKNGGDSTRSTSTASSTTTPPSARPPAAGRRRRPATATPWQRWATPAGPSWRFDAAFARYRAGFRIGVGADASIRGSRTGELVARCMVETGTSSHYTALADAASQPVLQEVCRLIAADEYRHFRLFYDHMLRHLERERICLPTRLRVAAGRSGESEDDELAYAFHCGNEPEGVAYDHDRCIAACMARAMGLYRFRHVERGTRAWSSRRWAWRRAGGSPASPPGAPGARCGGGGGGGSGCGTSAPPRAAPGTPWASRRMPEAGARRGGRGIEPAERRGGRGIEPAERRGRGRTEGGA